MSEKKYNVQIITVTAIFVLISLIFLLSNYSIVFAPKDKTLELKRKNQIEIYQNSDQLEIHPESTIAINETSLVVAAGKQVLEIDILTGKVTQKHDFNHEIYYLLDKKDEVIKYVTLIDNAYWYVENNNPKFLLEQFSKNPNFIDDDGYTNDFKKGIVEVNYISQTNIIQFRSQTQTLVFDLLKGETIEKYEHPEYVKQQPGLSNRGRAISLDGYKTLGSDSLYNVKEKESLKFYNLKEHPAKFSYFSEKDKTENTIYTKTYKNGLFKTNLKTGETVQILTEEGIAKLGLVGQYISNINGDYAEYIKYAESKSVVYDESGLFEKSLIGEKILATPEKTYLLSLGKNKKLYLIDLKTGLFLREITIHE